MRQEHPSSSLQSDVRPGPRRPCRGQRPARRRGRRDDPQPARAAPEGRHGVSASKPVSDVHPRQRRLRAPVAWVALGPDQDGGRAKSRACRIAGRGQRQAQRSRGLAIRRPAAALGDCSLHSGQSSGDPHGRALLSPRPCGDDQDRRPNVHAHARLHDRDRHPQHATGCPSF